jgi:hypothetical protein
MAIEFFFSFSFEIMWLTFSTSQLNKREYNALAIASLFITECELNQKEYFMMGQMGLPSIQSLVDVEWREELLVSRLGDLVCQLLLESLVVQVEQMRDPFDFGLGANFHRVVKVLVLLANEIDVANVQDGRQYLEYDLLLRFAEAENVDGRNERLKVLGVVFVPNRATLSLKIQVVH